MAGMNKMGEAMMHSGMAGMDKMGEAMMHSGMAGMGKMGEAMTHSTMAGMGKMNEAMMHSMMGGAATAGVAATAGKSTLKKILTHPVTLIGFGFALGYLAYKYRKDIISEQLEE